MQSADGDDPADLPDKAIPEVPPPHLEDGQFDDYEHAEAVAQALPGYHLRPLHNIVVLELYAEPRLAPPVPPPSQGVAHVRALLALPETEQAMCGVVVARGPGTRAVALGDAVVVHRAAGAPLCLDGRRLLMVGDGEILAVLTAPRV
eukprot:EG_transcript_19042